MKKLLVIILVGLVVATAASYFGMQWRVKKAVDDMIAAVPMVDANYSGVSLDFNGKLAINDLQMSILIAGIELSVGQIAIETGGFWETLGLDKRLDEGKLPESMKFSLSNVALDYTPEMAASMAEQSIPDNLSQLWVLGCGDSIAIGPQEMYEMGTRSINFDMKMGYDYQQSADQLIATLDMYIDGLGHFILSQTAVGVAPLMQDYRSLMFGFDPSAVVTQNIHVEYVDLGYNAKVRDYCAKAAGLSVADYTALHETMLQDALAKVDFRSEFDFWSVYRELKQARARLVVDLRPMAGFSVAEVMQYEINDLIEMLELQINLNDKPVEIGELSLNAEKWAGLDLVQLRRSYRVGPDAEGELVLPEDEAQALERILKEVPARSLDQYVHRVVQIQRFDGQVFSGEMTSVTASRVIIRSRLGTGYTELPIPRSQIKTAKLYPEE